ncbi:methionyl-tRNA formyltransferase [marine bacterium AO1-C]|nr:methionyl-tRNA formyltransferase [marine bacterium AO1-C]
MKHYLIVSEKEWNQHLSQTLQKKIKANWSLIKHKQDFELTKLAQIKPDKIFIPHWSYIIPPEIYENYECVVFHMTDLPYGRGGSPLQNLIVRGHKNTKISALRVVKELDAGDIYLKKDLSLLGTAEEIFLRSSKVIEEMIVEIITHELVPTTQQGQPTVFKRRKPTDGNMIDLSQLDQIYDYIRMLDAENYPKAYIETKYFKLEFSRASLKADQSIIADVRITPKET